jgi:xeroderma pigmentosum group C-complementing protein
MALTPQKAAALKSKGKTRDDAIVLDDSGDKDSDKNNLAVVTPEASLASNAVGNGHGYETSIDHDEEKQLQASAKKEPIPTSKAGFKKHPLYVIPSVLNSTEVIVPDAKKRACGVFKGELVYLRKDVETALPAKRWLYFGRKVKESELPNPVLIVKARKKPVSKSFKALKSYGVGKSNDGSEEARAKQIHEASQPLDDGKQHLYCSWQTEAWSPTPVGRNDPIPANEYDNVELELLNPGLVHVELDRVAKVAKELSIPYKPCLLGFENNGGNSTPSIRGIVVHEHNEILLREAHQEMSSHFLQQEHENRQAAILRKWKRLLVGVLTKDRLDRTYGDDT